jgi:hypothetical protein
VLVKQNGLPPMHPGLEGCEAATALRAVAKAPESLVFCGFAAKNAPIFSWFAGGGEIPFLKIKRNPAQNP